MISDIPKLFIKCSQTCWGMMTEKTYNKRFMCLQREETLFNQKAQCVSLPFGCGGWVVWFTSGSGM